MAKPGSPWTQREIDFLVRNYQKLTSKEMAAKLQRPYGGVVWKIQDLGLPNESTYAELQHELRTRTDRNKPKSTSGSVASKPVGYPGVRTPMREPLLPPVKPGLLQRLKDWWNGR